VGRALAGSPFGFLTTMLGKSLLGGGHAHRLAGDELRDHLQLLRGVVHLADALAEARLLVGHRVGKRGLLKLDRPAAAHPALKTLAPQESVAVTGAGPNAKPAARMNPKGALTAAGVLGHRP
jgi:hypothetical protein